MKIKPGQVIDAPATNLAFQEDEIEGHSLDIVDDVLGPINDSNGGFMEVDDRHDSVLKDETEPDCETEDKSEDDEAEYISSDNEL